MQIYVVKQGDSLYQIANQFGISSEAIATANEINPEQSLVVGQALVIPTYGRFYTVQPGDSLYTIGQRFQISVAELASINQINVYQPLSIGMTLYIPEQAKTDIVANAYIEPTGNTVSPALESAARKHAEKLTYLAPSFYRVDREGNLTAPPLNDFPAIARENGVTLMMPITNLEEGAFSADLGQIILTNETVQNRLLDQIIATAKEVGFGDIHFDFEFLPPENREDYNHFLEKATERLHQEGLQVSTALAPKTSATQEGMWYEAHDYKAHGEIVDFVVLMTYEWGYSGGPPMAVSPIGPVRDVVNYALSEMPANKILLGQNLYGYDWTLPYEPGGEYARAISPQRAIQIARDYQQAILFDERAMAPYFFYTDEDGNRHEVWFEDARSIEAKFDLIKEKQLLGISYWKLGLSFPQNWLLLTDQFYVQKLR